MNKFRASYSILNAWAANQYDRAVGMYFKIQSFTTPAMADGKLAHQQWAEYIMKHKALPTELGGKKLHNPQTEIKLVSQLDDWLELVGVIDCIDEYLIYEHKTGGQTSDHYARTRQPGVYAVLCELNKIKVDACEINCFNKLKQKTQTSTVWLTDKVRRDSLEWIITQSAEMHSYLTENGLYYRFGGQYA